jgi:hypothetical protein
MTIRKIALSMTTPLVKKKPPEVRSISSTYKTKIALYSMNG